MEDKYILAIESSCDETSAAVVLNGREILSNVIASQWGKVVDNEQRLIDNGHFMKTSEQAKLSYLREEIKKSKKVEKTVIVLVKK